MKLITNDGEEIKIRHYEQFRSAVSRGNPREVWLKLRNKTPRLSIVVTAGILEMDCGNIQATKNALKNWRSLKGLRLFVDGKACGLVSKSNPRLIEGG
jgi:hypothetical protein